MLVLLRQVSDTITFIGGLVEISAITPSGDVLLYINLPLQKHTHTHAPHTRTMQAKINDLR